MFLRHSMKHFPKYVRPQKSDSRTDYAEQDWNAGQMQRERERERERESWSGCETSPRQKTNYTTPTPQVLTHTDSTDECVANYRDKAIPLGSDIARKQCKYLGMLFSRFSSGKIKKNLCMCRIPRTTLLQITLRTVGSLSLTSCSSLGSDWKPRLLNFPV
jgi:hypothetical protein